MQHAELTPTHSKRESLRPRSAQPPKFRAVLCLALILVPEVLIADATTQGLVAYYNFNGNLNDSSGNGFNLNPGGTFNYVTGFDGTPNGAVQLVTAASNGTFFLGTGPDLANTSSTVSFWVRKDYVGNGSNGSWVFGLGDPAGTGGSQGADMHVALDYGESIRYSFFYDDLNSYTPLPNYTWVNITCTFDYATGVRDIYINGQLDISDIAAYPFSGGNYLKIGFPGLSLDDFRLYNRDLSQSEVAALAAVPEPAITPFFLGLAVLGFMRFRKRGSPSN